MVDTHTADTFPKLLLENAARRPARPAMREKRYGIWKTWTWADLTREIEALSLGLKVAGIAPGQRVAVIGVNRSRLYWSILAAQCVGAVPVPLYPDAVAQEMAYLLAHAEVTAAIVEDQEQVDKLLSVLPELPALRLIAYDEPRGMRDYVCEACALTSLDAIMASGRQETAGAGLSRAFTDLVARTGGGDTSIILYTSGTTGRPKGTVISAERAISAARQTVAADGLDETDEVLAYLPIAWGGDHYLNYAQAFVAGFCMSCPEEPETVAIDIFEIGPTFYFAPPRVLEDLLTRIMISMEDAGRAKRWLFDRFMGVARCWGEPILNGRADVPLHGRLLYALGEALIYGPVKNVLGFSRIKVAYTAGEAIGPDLFTFYRSIGVNLKQFYGQTEAFLYISAQPDGQIRSDTVGPAAPGVEIRIMETGEVQFRSPGQFVEYLADPDRTAETLTPDGFVRTGDAGFIGQDGHLRVIDRAKDVGHLTDGTLFAPKYIENKLKFFPNIKEAVAFGDGHDYVAAFINIDLTAVGNWAERNGVTYGSYQELAALPQVYDIIRGHIRQVNRDLAGEPAMAGAAVSRFVILHKELDADDGELTRTRKVRRAFVQEKYADLIAALYADARECFVSTEVTFEDGRKGRIEATLALAEVGEAGRPRHRNVGTLAA
ncbi:MAG: AMP-binding protein [Pseudomonadota bacterium]